MKKLLFALFIALGMCFTMSSCGNDKEEVEYFEKEYNKDNHCPQCDDESWNDNHFNQHN